MTDQPLFAVDSVRKRFRSREVLSAASVWVWPTRVTALIGRNGCGKSTLLRVAVGQLRAEFGVVRFANERTNRPELGRLARQGLFLWPDAGLLPVGLTVKTILDAVARQVPDADIEGAAELTRTRDLFRQTVHTLSGGERRRVELAVALARRPRCLLADEPFLGVMPVDRQVLIDGFRALTDGGTGVLLTGHEVDTLLELADDVVWMTAGATHHLGPPDQARQHDQFRREYLGS